MQTESRLRSAIDRAYDIFSIYPRPVSLEASPVHDPSRLFALTTTSLQSLSIEDLMGYCGSAMTTIGMVDDYRYFLPRILELATKSGLIDPEMIALKLEYGAWQDWPVDQKDAVIGVFNLTFVRMLAEHPDEIGPHGWFCGIGILGMDIAVAIDVWKRSTSPNAALQLAHLLRTSTLFETDKEDRAYWSNVAESELHIVRRWLLGRETRDRLASARNLVGESDVWMVDLALDMQEQLIASQPQ